MKQLLLFIFVMISVNAFSQDLTTGKVRERSWNVAAGYSQPVGGWATAYDWEKGQNHELLSNGGHAQWGINASLYRTTIRRRAKGGHMFGMLFSPFGLRISSYNMKSVNGPAIESKKIRPFVCYEFSIAPFYAIDVNGIRYSVYSRFGISALNTKGNIIYVRNNFDAPIYYPKYYGNDRYAYSADYKYSGIGVVFAPGIKVDKGKFGIMIELSLEAYAGRYSGNNYFHDYFENQGQSAAFSNESLGRFHENINASVSYRLCNK